jgi:hypothetical protein
MLLSSVLFEIQQNYPEIPDLCYFLNILSHSVSLSKAKIAIFLLRYLMISVRSILSD